MERSPSVKQRQNFTKLTVIAIFLATTPDKLIKDDDVAEGKKAAQAALEAWLTNPVTQMYYKKAQENNWVDENGNLTGAGQSVAQASLNARPGQPVKLNYEQFVKGLKLSAMISLQNALTAEFRAFFEKPEVEFIAKGDAKQIFDETIDLFLAMCGETIEEDPVEDEALQETEEVIAGEV